MTKDPVIANTWLPVCESKEVTDSPIQEIILDERIMLFRTSSGVKAFKDLCIHRGVALSLGKVKNDCIACPYHGWEYDGDGKCVYIPQLPKERPIPLKAKATTYGCMEKYGLIWVNLGNNNPEPPTFEPLDDASFKYLIFGPKELKCAAPRYIESTLDIAHFAFTHDGYLGDSSMPEISDYRVYKEGKKLVSGEISIYQPNGDMRMGVTNHYIQEIMGPLTSATRKLDKETGDIVYIATSVLPIDERTSRVFIFFGFNFDMDLSNYYPYQNILFEQDKMIVENQKPEELPLDLQEELHLNPDRISIAYRKYLYELGVQLGTA